MSLVVQEESLFDRNAETRRYLPVFLLIPTLNAVMPVDAAWPTHGLQNTPLVAFASSDTQRVVGRRIPIGQRIYARFCVSHGSHVLS